MSRVLVMCAVLVTLVSPATAQNRGQSSGQTNIHGPEATPPWLAPTAMDYATASAGLGAFYGLLRLNREVQRSPWTDPVLFDRGARNWLRVGSQDARNTLDSVSDLMLYTLMLAPNLVDIPVGWSRYGSRAAEMFVINVQAQGFAGMVTELTKLAIGRGRPYLHTCNGPDPDEECDAESRDESMISGHAAGAFTGAGLLCLHHVDGELFGNAAADTAMCASGLVLASATSLLRVSVDKHYVSDVLLGAAIGFVMGYWVPKWLHYRQPKGDGNTEITVAPMAGSSTLGLAIGGVL